MKRGNARDIARAYVRDHPKGDDETPTIGMFLARRLWEFDRQLRDTTFARHPLFPLTRKRAHS